MHVQQATFRSPSFDLYWDLEGKTHVHIRPIAFYNIDTSSMNSRHTHYVVYTCSNCTLYGRHMQWYGRLVVWSGMKWLGSSLQPGRQRYSAVGELERSRTCTSAVGGACDRLQSVTRKNPAWFLGKKNRALIQREGGLFALGLMCGWSQERGVRWTVLWSKKERLERVGKDAIFNAGVIP